MMDPKAVPATASGNVANNMYRVGEFVYMDSKGAHPYLIRRIEEFTKNPGGVNDVRVTVVYRRRDISTAILRVADAAERNWPDYLMYDEVTGEEIPMRNENPLTPSEEELKASSLTNGSDKKENGRKKSKDGEEENEVNDAEKKDLPPFDWGLGGLPYDAHKLTEDERYQLRQREVFLSRKEEKLSVSHIRGKCSVNLLSDIEASHDYINRKDIYFYSLFYDCEKLTMLADKGAIRVGSQYQAVVPEFDKHAQNGDIKEEAMEVDENKENGDLMIDEIEEEETPKKETEDNPFPLELPVFTPCHGLSDKDIDRYMIHVKAIGVFARVIDPNSTSKYPSAQMIAALASRDSTSFYAMGLLHKAGYDIHKAQDFLVPSCSDAMKFPLDVNELMGFNTLTLGGPMLIRDQLEEFSPPEATLFEEGIDRIGKDFSDIRSQLLPWKSLASIVEYYYLYKTTSRYIDGKKKRQMVEKDNKLLQVYVPNVVHESNAFIIGTWNSTTDPITNEKGCTGCGSTSSVNFYKWGTRGDDAILCHDCWTFWRKYGGLKVRTDMDHFDTDIAADPDIAQEMLKSLSYATPSCAKGQKDPKRYGANSYTMYTVVSASDLHMGGGGSSSSNSNNKKTHINLKTNLFTKMIRRALPKHLLSVKKMGRSPFVNLNMGQINSYIYSIDQAKLCEVLKQMVAPNLNITPATFQTAVSNMISQFSGTGKRPASVGLDGQPPQKRAPALCNLPFIVEDPCENSQGTGVFTFFSGPRFRQRRRLQINGKAAHQLARRPLQNHSELLCSLVSNNLFM